ncbi:MAG: hypothetical protein KGZ86_00070 [Candidatus Latescibacteria bacterium]|nr:hypothetical protein [Candidatus Latescibacterota bacterium]
MYKNVLFIITILLLIGCTTKFVMIHGVPKSPTFVIIPNNFSEADLSFANLITEALIANGIRVLERPVMLSRSIESEKSADAGGLLWSPGTGLGIASGGSKGNEKIREFSDPIEVLQLADADYVIYVQEKGNWVKMIHRATKQVIFVGSMRTNEPPIEIFKKLFKKMEVID